MAAQLPSCCWDLPEGPFPSLNSVPGMSWNLQSLLTTQEFCSWWTSALHHPSDLLISHGDLWCGLECKIPPGWLRGEFSARERWCLPPPASHCDPEGPEGSSARVPHFPLLQHNFPLRGQAVREDKRGMSKAVNPDRT